MTSIRHFGVENSQQPEPNNATHNSIMLGIIIPEPEKDHLLAVIFTLVFIVGILAFGLYLIH
jgi:hypothetical protein